MSSSAVDDSHDDDAVLIGNSDVEDYNDSNILPQVPERQAAIQRWLDPTSYDADNGEYRKHLACHKSGTGDWLWASDMMCKWHKSDDHGLLWIKGIPGSGKSVIAANIIQRLKNEKVPVLYFFFRQIIDANYKPDALLRDWLSQVLSYSPPLQETLWHSYLDSDREMKSLSMKTLWELLRLALDNLQKVYCVVDALDEMDQGKDYEEFLQELANLGQWRPGRVKVLMTGRPVASVEAPLRKCPMLQIRLEERLVDIDIATYVDSRLTESSIAKHEHSAIKNAVPGRANGIFLYAKLAMDAFLKDGADVTDVLRELPLDLNVMYMNVLREHARRSGISEDLQLLILSWTTHASRPLRLLEAADLIHVLELAPGVTGLKATKELVRTACGPLLEILADETISVVHHSLTEFLNGSTRKDMETPSKGGAISFPTLEKASTHSRLAQTCVAYLLQSHCLEKVQVEPNDNDDDFSYEIYSGRAVRDAAEANKKLYSQYHFLTYALENLPVHAKKAGEDASLSSALIRDLCKLLTGETFSAFVMLRNPWSQPTTPLHFAAKHGLSQFLAALVQNKEHDIDGTDFRGNTPLLLAAAAGHHDMVKTLIDSGAKPDESSRVNGMKPLHEAAYYGHAKVVDMLLAAGVDPLTEKTKENPGRRCGNAGTTVGHTPLMYAICNRHSAAALAFVPHLKEKTAVDRALVWASEHGCQDVIEALLQHPLVDVDAKVRGDTALFVAARNYRIAVMNMLLKAGADPSIFSWWADDEFAGPGRLGRGAPDDPWYYHGAESLRNRIGFNALHAVCCGNGEGGSNRLNVTASELRDQLETCLSLMLKGGLDIDKRDESGMTALLYTVQQSPIMTEVLLKAGARADLTSPKGDSALDLCSSHTTARLLVKHAGFAIDRRRLKDGRTPFLSAIETANPHVVEQYRDLGANLNLTDHDGRGALHIFIAQLENYYESEECAKVAEALIQAGVSPTATDHLGRTPLHLLRSAIHEDTVRVLLEGGADVNAQDHHGKTPLFYFVSEIRISRFPEITKILEIMRKHHVRFDAQDHRGRTALFYCLRRMKYPELVTYLQEQGLDFKSRDYEGNTLWHASVSCADGSGNWTLFPQLGEIDAEMANFAGQTPLHLYYALHSDGFQRLRNILPPMEDYDRKDNDGIRPIHIAARQSLQDVAFLLGKGANPTEPTHEGITPLHVAARFRQPNIVGMLLERIGQDFGRDALMRHLNIPHRAGTPSVLHIACRSGIPETVSLLLAAGANPTPDMPDASAALLACVEYEDEQKLWTDCRFSVEKDPDEITLRSLGIKLEDNYRHQYGETHVSRLEEILYMLHEHESRRGVQVGFDQYLKDLDNAIGKSAEKDYTAVCLLNARRLWTAGGETDDPSKRGDELSHLESYAKSFTSKSETNASYHALLSVSRFIATQRALLEARPWEKPALEGYGTTQSSPRAVTNKMLKDHLWNIAERIFKERPEATEKFWGQDSILAVLIKFGLDVLVSRVLTSDMVARVQDQYHALCGAETISTKPELELPLLIACKGPHGNLPMLRLLVERLGVDVNLHELFLDSDGKTLKKGDTAVHILASGDAWWQVAEGLRFLIDKGADLEVRDSSGRTPLMRALSKGVGGIRAARMLIEGGADIHASDMHGNTCLSSASGCVELTELLVKHGAPVTAAALIGAIKARNTKTLETLCANGDPNIRIPEYKETGPHEMHKGSIARHEEYPLYAATVGYVNWDYTSRFVSNEEALGHLLPLITVLLKHGANPFAEFRRLVKPSKGRNHGATSGEADTEKKSVPVTLLHHIFETGGIVDPFFDLEHLNLEYRDEQGRTLLLAACDNSLGPDCGVDDLPNCNPFSPRSTRGQKNVSTQKPCRVELLLDKGACPTAQDKKGLNALHHIFQANFIGKHKALKALLDRAGGKLVEQVDRNGETPLHYVLRSVDTFGGPDPSAIEMLLQHGADPHIVDAKGNNPLHHLGAWLSERGMFEGQEDQPRRLFQHLLSLGIAINARNHDGKTPLLCFMENYSSYHGREYVEGEDERQKAALKIFADGGADAFIVLANGDTLLHVVAATEKYVQEDDHGDRMVERFNWLLEQGLDPMTENYKHQTCLDVATLHKNGRILELFSR